MHKFVGNLFRSRFYMKFRTVILQKIQCLPDVLRGILKLCAVLDLYQYPTSTSDIICSLAVRDFCGRLIFAFFHLVLQIAQLRPSLLSLLFP